MTNKLYPVNRIDCRIYVWGVWQDAHLSQVQKDDWFRLLGSDDVHIALGDAYCVTNDETGEQEWKVEAKWCKTE